MWQDKANDLIAELSEDRDDLNATIADLEHAIITDNKTLFLEIAEIYGLSLSLVT